MPKEREAIEIVEGIVKSYIEADECGLSNNDFKHEIRALQTVLSMLKEKDEKIEYYKKQKDYDDQFKHELLEQIRCLNLDKDEKDKEIEQKDNAIRKVINRLDNDINRITKSKLENKLDDYRRCRLKAYKTKTREIKEYIEEQYFKNKAKE